MFTLSKLLQFPIFAQAKVVAGEKGLDNSIEWSHIIDVPDVVEMVGEGRQLILTTGQGLPQAPQAQSQFIADLAAAGLSGIIISVGGKFLQEIPQPFISAADKLGFPVITIPRDLRFVDITRLIHEKIISRQYALLKESDHIHQTLTQIVLEGGGLQDLANALSDLVERSVTIEDPDLNLLAHATHGEIDRARLESIESGGTPKVIRRFVKEQGILDKVKNSLKPMPVPAFPEHGMTKRIVAPILVERQLYGYLWFIAGQSPLDEADTMAIERAAIVAALTMLKDTAVRQTEARLQADVISQLLSGNPHTPALEDKANRLGLNLKQPQRVLLLRPPVATLPSLRLADKLKPVLQKVTSEFIIQIRGQNMILILSDAVDAKALGQSLLNALPGLKIGVGNTAPTLINLSQSYQEAKEALEIGLLLNDISDIHCFEDLGLLHWLYQLPPEAKPGNRYAARIQVLAAEEKAARAELLRTLEVFLDYGANAAETARAMKIHRNTLTYRLKQIENYTQLSLNDPKTRLNLQVAVKALRLEGRKTKAEGGRLKDEGGRDKINK